MTDNTFFEIFILLDVFVIGMLSTTAIRHAYAHFRPQKHEPEINPAVIAAADIKLPTAVKERLLQASQDQFQAVLNSSANLLQQDLGTTTEQINNLVNKLATEIVSRELEKYRTELSQLHNQADVDMGGIEKELKGHEAELKAKVAEELEAEKQQLLKQIDTKLADAVGSFLIETLQHNIDLGTQGSYLIAMLEEHKADFTKEVADEAQPTK
jgi:hypothetical protein